MLTHLVASDSRRRLRLGPAGPLSLFAHAAVVAGALWATANRAEPAAAFPDPDSLIEWVMEPAKAPGPELPVRETDFGVPPGIDRDGLPVLDFRSQFDLTSFTAGGDSALTGHRLFGPPGWDGTIVSPHIADQPPELLAASRVYPRLLQQAGIEGRVVVRAVVDTSGRVEAASVEIVSSTNPEFSRAARAMLLGAVFRPGRVQGRAVRVAVELPVDFRVSRR